MLGLAIKSPFISAEGIASEIRATIVAAVGERRRENEAVVAPVAAKRHRGISLRAKLHGECARLRLAGDKWRAAWQLNRRMAISPA